MKSIAVLALGAVLAMSVAGSSRADVVTDWNATSFDVMTAANVGGAPGARAFAMRARVDGRCVNAVQNAKRAMRTRDRCSLASDEIAASSAARSALLALLPGQRARIDAAHAAATTGVADGPAQDAGVGLGEEAAAAVLADRTTDESSVPDTYRPITAPGNWVPTTPPLTAQYARAKPWGFDKADRFRPGPPAELSSSLYARDYNETKDFGGIRSAQRTAAQADAVNFVADQTSSVVLRCTQPHRTPGQSGRCARAFALMSSSANRHLEGRQVPLNFWRPQGDRNGEGNERPRKGAVDARPTPRIQYRQGGNIAVRSGMLGRRSATARRPDTITTRDDKLKRSSQHRGDGRGAGVLHWGGIIRNSLESAIGGPRESGLQTLKRQCGRRRGVSQTRSVRDEASALRLLLRMAEGPRRLPRSACCILGRKIERVEGNAPIEKGRRAPPRGGRRSHGKHFCRRARLVAVPCCC